MRLIQLLLCLLVFLSTGLAKADFVAFGTLQYNRNWFEDTTIYDQTGSLLPPAQRTGVFPLRDVQVCARKVSDGSVTCGAIGTGFTGSTGAFSVSLQGAGVTGGTQLQLLVRFAGRDRNTIPAVTQGYRVVATNGSSVALEAVIGATFVAPASGLNNRGTQAFTTCVPATATCPNDFANGHQALQWTVESLSADANSTAAGPGFRSAVNLIKYHTDRTSGTQCGFTGCCNFDFGVTVIQTCWHEMGHSMADGTLFQRTGGSFGQFAGQNPCAGDEAGGPAISEAFANFNALKAAYSVANIAILPTLAGACFTSAQPAADTNNDCTSCEFTPNVASYPMPLTCGNDPVSNVRRTECRHLKLLIDIMDSVAVNGASCLSENLQLTTGAFFNALTNMANSTAEEGVQEIAIGGTAVGTAQAASDAFTIMDLLRVMPGVTADKYKVWANACYMPGEANWGAGNFLPAGGQDNPPF